LFADSCGKAAFAGEQDAQKSAGLYAMEDELTP
jgi:hypothetical protein